MRHLGSDLGCVCQYAAQDKMVRSLVYKLAQFDAASPGRDNTELAEATARFKAEIKSVAGAAATREQRALKQLAALRTARDQAEQSATVAQHMLQEVLRPRIIGGGGRSGTLGQLYRSKLTATHGAPVAPRAPARPGGATATLSSYSFPRRTLSSRYSLPSVSTDASSIVPVSDSKDGEAVPKSALMTLTSGVSAIAQ